MKTTKAYCYDCDRDTNQSVLYSTTRKRTYPDYDRNGKDEIIVDVTEKNSYSIIRCLGCETHSFLEVTTYSNDLDHNDLPLRYCSTYPSQDEYENEEEDGFYLAPHEIKILPTVVKNLYKEIIISFRNDLDILSGMGLRSLIEAICINRNIPGKTLYNKIENLHKEGYISQKEMPILQKLRQIGNSTVHEVQKPSAAILDHSLGIINHTLRAIYYMPKMEAKITKKTKPKVATKSSI